jgi:hypothetical protein
MKFIEQDVKEVLVSGEQIEEVVGKMPAVEADVKSNKQNISALQTASAKHAEDIAKNTADIALKANAEEVYTISQTVEAVTETVAEIVANADDDFDTLRELSDWLKNHSGSAAEMNTAIQANAKAIADNKAEFDTTTAEMQTEIDTNKTDILNVSEQIEKHYGLGTIIPTGADLNNSTYFKPGVYRAPSNSVAESLLNCPVKRGFRMEVKTTIYDGMAVRFIYPNAHSALFGTYYMQNVISDGVSNWYKFSGEEIIPTATTTE